MASENLPPPSKSGYGSDYIAGPHWGGGEVGVVGAKPSLGRMCSLIGPTKDGYDVWRGAGDINNY